MELDGFSIVIFILAFLVFWAGLYVYKGHNSELLLWKGYNKNATKQQLRVTGGWTMIASGIILIIGIIGMFLDV